MPSFFGGKCWRLSAIGRQPSIVSSPSIGACQRSHFELSGGGGKHEEEEETSTCRIAMLNLSICASCQGLRKADQSLIHDLRTRIRKGKVTSQPSID